MFTIDIHTHIIPKNWPNLRDKYGYGGFVQIQHDGPGCARMLRDGEVFRKIESNCWDPDCRLNDCKQSGVDVQVLSTVPVMFSYWAKPQHALDLSRLLNDHIAAVVAEHPKRFVGLGTVPLQSTKLAVLELERCVGELKLAGIQIGSHVNGLNLNEEQFFPIFEAAQDLGVAILVHPWDMLAKDRMKKYWLEWLVGMPVETSLAICSMIFGGIFDRFPKLRVAFAHGGGAFPITFGRIQHGFTVRPDLCAVDNATEPREYLGRFYVDSLVHDPRALNYLIDFIGVERIAMGSDYPFPLGESRPGKMINQMGFSSAKSAQLLHGSALDWLGMEMGQFR